MSAPVLAAGGIVLSNEHGTRKLCLVRRANPPMEGSWTLPGGRVQQGERLVDACAREVREETGLVVEVGPLIEVVELIGRKRHYVVHDYACRIIGGSLKAADDAADATMAPMKELASYELTDAVHRVVAKSLQRWPTHWR